MPRLFYLILFVGGSALAHEPIPRELPTYAITPPSVSAGARALRLEIRDAGTGERTPARFTMLIDGRPYVPPALDGNGLRFTSIHARKKQEETVLYARGTGPVRIPLPDQFARGTITVTKGYAFRPVRIPFEGHPSNALEVSLENVSTLADGDWVAADTHLHYERINPEHDTDWFTMLEADGLRHGHFMVLKGGNFEGTWAQQYTYGKEGVGARDRLRLIPGEEFRGPLQGHNNLLGIGALIEPISVGGMGKPPHPPHWPLMHDVLLQARASGGIGGPAHGGTFGKASTAILDAVLGASEFFELANTHLYELDPWYRLMNCGFILAPIAGTDLPNFPYRDSWQPFFGETRTYARGDPNADFGAWARAVRRGETFITSGPLIDLEVGPQKVGPGGIVPLDGGGGPVSVTAVVHGTTPASLQLELVVNGTAMPLSLERDESGRVHIELPVTVSSWIALRARGRRKDALWAGAGVLQYQVAHTAAVRVLVNRQPVTSTTDAASLIDDLEKQRAVYGAQARFPDEDAKAYTLNLFDQAISLLSKQK